MLTSNAFEACQRVVFAFEHSDGLFRDSTLELGFLAGELKRALKW
jgi:hypothetical protein